MYLLSSLVWKIDVQGNKLIRGGSAGSGQGGGRVYIPVVVAAAGAERAVSASCRPHAGCCLDRRGEKGTRIILQVVESKRPEARSLSSLRHIISSSDAVVTRIIADKGRPVVRVNTKVKKGQVLISGTIGEGANTATVAASGQVRGLVWHEYNIVSPLVLNTNVYTGETKTGWKLVLFGRALRVSGFGKAPFTEFQTREELEQLGWRDWKLPVGRMKETLMEVRHEQQTVTREEAVRSGLLQAQADVLSRAGADAVVREQKILHEKTDNGKVYMKVLLEVDQSIVKEMPLVQMQGE